MFPAWRRVRRRWPGSSVSKGLYLTGFWQQPLFMRLALIREEACPKAGCSQNWPPYKMH